MPMGRLALRALAALFAATLAWDFASAFVEAVRT
jgi:hypothetical protein